MMKSVNIGIIGYGTVGHGVVEILYKNGKLIEKIATLRSIFMGLLIDELIKNR